MNRRLRAIIVFATLWAMAWGLVGLLFGAIIWLRFHIERHVPWGLLEWALRSSVPYVMVGGICGAGFAVLLSRAERDRAVGELTLSRISLWGTLAGAGSLFAFIGIRSAITGVLVPIVPILATGGILGLLGGLSAIGSLAMARKGRLGSAEDTLLVATPSVKQLT